MAVRILDFVQLVPSANEDRALGDRRTSGGAHPGYLVHGDLLEFAAGFQYGSASLLAEEVQMFAGQDRRAAIIARDAVLPEFLAACGIDDSKPRRYP